MPQSNLARSTTTAAPHLALHRPPHPGGLKQAVRDLQQMLDNNQAEPSSNRQPSVVPVTRSKKMERLIERAMRFARSTATLLLTGESGTGKELVANLIHQHSPRADQPYIRINCAALAETLLESELFGHERGAFTGAFEARQGRLAAAADGTILLDEISEIPPRLQAKLLRVLEEKEFQIVGSNVTNRVDARVIATTNRCLARETAEGRFREDLFHRLCVLELHIPPLRERPEDVAVLAEFFVRRFAQEGEPAVRGISSEAVAMLCDYPWPGNVRQLRNVIHRACVVAESGTIGIGDLELKPPHSSDPSLDHLAHMRLEDLEREVIFAALRQTQGKKTVAARQLGVNPKTLTNKLKRYRDLGYSVGEFFS